MEWATSVKSTDGDGGSYIDGMLLAADMEMDDNNCNPFNDSDDESEQSTDLKSIEEESGPSDIVSGETLKNSVETEDSRIPDVSAKPATSERRFFGSKSTLQRPVSSSGPSDATQKRFSLHFSPKEVSRRNLFKSVLLFLYLTVFALWRAITSLHVQHKLGLLEGYFILIG